tara:strand:- start:1278 stop:1418 length:141 start_codon:yes stop_codon:yes gene_type:complete
MRKRQRILKVYDILDHSQNENFSIKEASDECLYYLQYSIVKNILIK